MADSFGTVEISIIAATLLGPILAVQAQRLVDIWREQSSRRLRIFHVLMATRAANLSAMHVEALNAIPIEFHGKKRQYREVVDTWRQYLDHLTNGDPELEAWGTRRQDLFIELLWKLSQALRYQFTKVELQREVYSPRAHATVEADQEVIRRGMSALFKGEASLPLDIKSIPTSPEVAQKQGQLQDLLLAWLAGQASVKVDVADQEK